MHKQTERFNATEADTRTVQETAASIRACCTALPRWFDYFLGAHANRIAHDLAMVRKEANKDSRILDIGTLPLLLSGSLCKLGYPICGVDIAPDRMADAIRTLKIDVRQCNIETDPLPYPDAHFDIIVFNEVFEHLRIDLVSTMKNIHRVLKPGGKLLLSTPNHFCLDNILRMIRQGRTMSMDIYSQYQHLAEGGHMGHVREYAPNDVSDFLLKTGFTPVTLIYRGRFGNNIAQACARLFPGCRPYFSIISTRN